MADDNSTTELSDATDVAKTQQKPKLSSRIARHLLKFWWLYLIIIVVIVLCTVLPIIYVYYPNKAQSEVNSSEIIATFESVTNPTPTGFTYENVATLLIAGAYDPTLFAWNGSYFLEGSDVPFLSVTIPEVTARNGTTIKIEEQVQIANMDEFEKNSNLIFSATNFSINLRGSGSLKQGGLPTVDVNYDKKIDLLGLNKLVGLEVTEFHILTSNLPDGANAAGNVTIPNPSIFALQMGNVTLDLSVNGTAIGNATLPDFMLRPGTNEYLLHVTSNQTQVLELLKLPAYRCGVLPIQIQGRHSTVDGQDIPYFSAPLQAFPLRTTLDLGPAFKEVGLGGFINGTCET